MKKIRVLIVEDSPTMRELITHIISQDDRLEVAAAVESGEDAFRILEHVKPDVISLDIRLPGMNGFEFTRKIMSESPLPIVVVSASVEAEDLSISMNALRAGALTVVEKPMGLSDPAYAAFARHLCTQLTIMSEVNVIRQRLSRFINDGDNFKPTSSRLLHPDRSPADAYQALGIGVSTGGPVALARIMGNLPRNFPLPIFLVQHITPAFLPGFATWLGTVCPFNVTVLSKKESPTAGNVYLSPSDTHLVLDHGCIAFSNAEPVCYQRPSVNILFQSMAHYYSRRAIGLLLTGMGEDGAEGLKTIKDTGGYTIAEDESTAVVYGMPGAAVKMGAVCRSLPLGQIADELIQLAKQGGAQAT
jgi:two-component system, chemotaxis family, protein-glutamate methylesterase/glutaminase